MQAIAEQDYTDALAAARVARAAVAQNRAALETARINLRYTTIRAPLGGRIGPSPATPGALVRASQARNSVGQRQRRSLGVDRGGGRSIYTIHRYIQYKNDNNTQKNSN